jgi:hypothetical protein
MRLFYGVMLLAMFGFTTVGMTGCSSSTDTVSTEEHDRPESQCFTCNPELFDKFAARYEAKFGEQPPKPTE